SATGPKLELRSIVLCSNCQSLRRAMPVRRRGPREVRPWRSDFPAQETCESCGTPVGDHEQPESSPSQASRLAKFGLAAGASPLLERAPSISPRAETLSKDR